MVITGAGAEVAMELLRKDVEEAIEGLADNGDKSSWENAVKNRVRASTSWKRNT